MYIKKLYLFLYFQAAVMRSCCVCKARKAGGKDVQFFDPNFPDETDVYDDDRGGGGAGLIDRWVSTRDKMSVSEMRINYKLFDCLKREFADPAFICNGCFDLLEQIDALQVTFPFTFSHVFYVHRFSSVF